MFFGSAHWRFCPETFQNILVQITADEAPRHQRCFCTCHREAPQTKLFAGRLVHESGSRAESQRYLRASQLGLIDLLLSIKRFVIVCEG